MAKATTANFAIVQNDNRQSGLFVKLNFMLDWKAVYSILTGEDDGF